MTAAPAQLMTDDVMPSRSRMGSFLVALRHNRLALVGAVGSLVFVVLGLVGVMLVVVAGLSDLFSRQNLSATFLPLFSPGHLLGTDNLGRDIAFRLVAGLGVSLVIGVVVTILSLSVGLLLGVLAGLEIRFVTPLVRGFIDLVLGFPVLLLAVVVAGALGPGLLAVVLAVGLTNWAGFALIVRADVLSLRQREFMEASYALGIPTWRIVTIHVVPNLIPPTLVMASYYMATAILVEAGFSFMGLGAQPPLPSLGQMIAEGRNFLSVGAWLPISAGLVLGAVILSLNLLGDGLRDILDPRLARE